MSPLWLVAAYTFHTFGELCLSPIGLSFVTKLAPVRMVALLMGIWFFATAIAEFLAGQLAALTDKIARGELFHLLGGQADFYLVLVVAPLAAARPAVRADAVAAPAHARTGRCERGSRTSAGPATVVGRGLRQAARRPPSRARTTSSTTCTASTSPIRTAGSRTPTRPRCSAGPTRRTPPRGGRSTGSPAAARSRSASGSSTRSVRSACPSRARSSRAAAATSTRAATASRTSPCFTCATARAATIAPLVDVNSERADGTRALDWWFPSDDGALVAYGVSDDGSEESVLRVRDVATGKDRADEIPRARSCSLAWTPDGRGFYYTRYPAPGEVPAAEVKYHRAVFHHRLGDDPAKDRKLFGDGRDMTDWPGVDLSPDGRWLAITVSQGWSKSEVYVVDVARGRRAGRRGRGRAGEVQRRRDARRSPVSVHDQRRVARPALRRRSGASRTRALARADQGVGRGPAERRLLPRRARGRVAAGRGAAPAPVFGRRRAARRHSAAGAGRAHGADRRARRRRDLLRVHVVLRADRDLSRRRDGRGRARRRRRGGSCRRRSTPPSTRSSG